jgi:hypothetical protein
MDTTTEARLVEIIDAALAEVSTARPAPAEVVDALLDLRLRVLELAVFDWIESVEGLAVDDPRSKRGGFVGLKKRPS